jgi:predicted metal-dependent HD superfamily phosphohydrolase
MDEHDFQFARYDLGFLQEQWSGLCARYGAGPSEIESLFKTLVDHYSAKDRAYHTLSHIQSLLSMGESFRDKFQNYDAVRFAIWFHDVIYNTKKSDNEEKSADFAVEALTNLGVSASTIVLAREMILATKHHRGVDLSWDAMAFLDMDTSILGAPEAVYKEYSRAIRKEYSWVLDFLYRKGRRKVLHDFLDRERIYFTEEIGSKYEAQARRNIEGEIRALSG